MDASSSDSYKPPPGFEEDTKPPLVKPELPDTTELWLLQWPVNQIPDFDGQEFSLEVGRDECLGSFKGLSGKEYDLVNCGTANMDTTVFASSGPESKIVGKISRRVALVHYPKPEELINNQKQIYQRSGGSSITNSGLRFTTPTQSSKLPRHSLSLTRSGLRASTYRSNISEVGEPSKPLMPFKGRQVNESSGSMDRHTEDSRRGQSGITTSGGTHHSSHREKSNKRIKKEK